MRTLTAEKNAFRANAKRAGLVYTERYTYDTLFNGFSISIEGSELGKLAGIPGVKNIYPVQTIDVPELQQGPAPELFTSLEMIGADIVQTELGYTGEGIKVAVMDTGIDYDHPDLGGCFGEGCRVAYGYDFVGDAFTGENMPVPDDDPDDCHGHGTHVAGIIGANGDVVVGVAPEVTFGAYRVFGCTGYTWSDIMIAAMEMALADGMDILNMSIGSAFTWPQYPTAMAANRLVNMGMVVVASIGNEGSYGLYSAGAPGLGEKVIGVASYDNNFTYLPYFTVGGENIG
jgi:subtilisin family serine protease